MPRTTETGQANEPYKTDIRSNLLMIYGLTLSYSCRVYSFPFVAKKSFLSPANGPHHAKGTRWMLHSTQRPPTRAMSTQQHQHQYQHQHRRHHHFLLVLLHARMTPFKPTSNTIASVRRPHLKATSPSSAI
ncbi:unnamed protein product, partial [Ectocarpus sp. 12 AP-2014]